MVVKENMKYILRGVRVIVARYVYTHTYIGR